VIFGTITRADLRGILDLGPREVAIFVPLILVVLWMGFYPNSFLRPIQPSVDHLVRRVSTAYAAAARAGFAREALVPRHAGRD
jgi:NADH-quinone oxidoreductase subunit M